MSHIIIDTWVNSDCTIGRLQYKNFRCMTLELPWENNTRNISCIPAGEYDAVQYLSRKFGSVVWIKHVDERSGIEIHPGNYTRQIRGCILVGDSIKYLDGDTILDVTNSRATLNKLMSQLPEEFTVVINRAF